MYRKKNQLNNSSSHHTQYMKNRSMSELHISKITENVRFN